MVAPADPMPSVAERRILMAEAPTLAGLYIRYIKFFDDMTHAVK